jgi:hypothetical protein
MLVVAFVAMFVVWGLVGRARAECGLTGTLVAFGALVPFFAIWLGVALLLPRVRRRVHDPRLAVHREPRDRGLGDAQRRALGAPLALAFRR